MDTRNKMLQNNITLKMQKPQKMSVQALKSPIITEGDDLLGAIVAALTKVRPSDGQILAISSKVVAVTQRRTVKIASKKLAKLSVAPEADSLAALVKQEADQIIGGSPVTLNLKNGIFTPWAGIDRSNTKKGTAVLWPAKPDRVAHQLQLTLKKKYKLNNFGVLIVDSFCAPLRRGVIGIALAHAGFAGVNDKRGSHDLYGNKLQFTQEAVADSLATMANFAMGQGNEQTPFAIIQNAPVKFSQKRVPKNELLMNPDECLYRPLYKSVRLKKN